MKKILFILLSTIILSCETTDDSSNENPTNDKLKRVEFTILDEQERIENYYFEYNNLGNITKFSNDTEIQRTYSYNSNNKIEKIEGYDLVDLETKINIEYTYVYNEKNQLIERHFKNDETQDQWENPQSKYYEYEGNDVLVTTKLNPTSFHVYSYSDNNQLLFSGEKTATTREWINTFFKYNYQYDEFGNIIYFSNEDKNVIVSAKYTAHLKFDIPGFTSEKNNPNLSEISIPQTYSKYFLSEITHELIGGAETYTTFITYDYEFDFANRVIKKTEQHFFNDLKEKTIIANYYWE